MGKGMTLTTILIRAHSDTVMNGAFIICAFVSCEIDGHIIGDTRRQFFPCIEIVLLSVPTALAEDGDGEVVVDIAEVLDDVKAIRIKIGVEDGKRGIVVLAVPVEKVLACLFSLAYTYIAAIGYSACRYQTANTVYIFLASCRK